MFDALFANSGISLDRLRTLCLVAKHGSLTRAAKVIDKENVPAKQSLFSRQIKELENFLGVDLLNRDAQPHRLTDAGHQLASIAHQSLTQLDDFTLNCGNQPIKLNIGAGESIIQWMLIPSLEASRLRQPTASIRLFNRTSQNITAGLMDAALDLGFMGDAALTKDLDHLPLGSFSYRLFVPKAMRTKLGETVMLDELAKLPLAMLEGGSGELRNAVEKLAAAQSLSLNVPIDCSSMTQIAYAINTRQYAGILPEFATKILSKDRINCHKIKGLELERNLVVAWNRKRKETRPAIEEAAHTFKQLSSQS